MLCIFLANSVNTGIIVLISPLRDPASMAMIFF